MKNKTSKHFQQFYCPTNYECTMKQRIRAIPLFLVYNNALKNVLIGLLEIKSAFVFYRVMLVSVPQSLHSHPSSSQSRSFMAYSFDSSSS